MIAMLLRSAVLASAVLLSAAVFSGANAAPGVATGSVNLRTGPGTNHARIAVIPAGAPVNIIRCGGWCEVIYAGRRGWASASYIARGSARVPRGYYLPDRSRCFGREAFSDPYCEWPTEEALRRFMDSNRDYNNRRDRRR